MEIIMSHVFLITQDRKISLSITKVRLRAVIGTLIMDIIEYKNQKIN